MPEYRVYFNQVNATYIDVKAESKAHAQLKASRWWQKENDEPSVRSIEVFGELSP